MRIRFFFLRIEQHVPWPQNVHKLDLKKYYVFDYITFDFLKMNKWHMIIDMY